MADDNYADENRKMIEWLSGKSPEHRHFVAMGLNWDYAETTLDWIVRQPDCDIATAVELFWLTNPDELLCYPTVDSLKYVDDWVFLLVKHVVDRAAAGDYRRSTISYNLDPNLAPIVEVYAQAEGEYRDAGLPWVAPRAFRVPFEGLTIAANGSDSDYWSDELRPLFEGLGTHIA